MDFINKKIETLLGVIERNIETTLYIPEFEYAKAPYKTSNTPPDDLNWEKFETGTKITGVDQHFWFKFHLKPIEKTENCGLRFSLKTGREGQWDATNPNATVYVDGKTIQTLDVNHTYFELDYNAPSPIYIYFYTGMNGGEMDILPSVKSYNRLIEKFYYDIKVPFDCLKCVPENTPEYYKIQNALNEALLLVDFRNEGSAEFIDSVINATEFLRAEFYGKECVPTEKTMSCLGHTHIDVAWLWTVAQTREKAQRSFSTVITLMERYPEYKFMSSQPILYKFIKEDDPDLYAKIKEKVKEKRWEVEGGMWLEADTNLTCGESLVRQILYGKRFMKEEFGVESEILWLPDVFGYSAALPQILRKSGIDKFFTAKLSWNETNKFPHSTFIWEGIDKSHVFSTIVPTYNGRMTPEIITTIDNKYNNKKHNQNTFMLFGFADGGGGPTDIMLETYDRLKQGIPGMPTTKIQFAKDYFKETEKTFMENCEKTKEQPKWVDELYLEYHRGTYTSIAKNKKNNRKSELLYQKAEALATTDFILQGKNYPQQAFEKSWETILLNQFHDIIPDSSIRQVYEQSDIEYAEIMKRGEEISCSALENIKKNLKTEGGIFVYNPTSYIQSDVVAIDGKTVKVENIPPHGWSVIKEPEVAENITIFAKILENNLIKIVFDDDYQIKSIFDKTAFREVLASDSKGNILEIYEDFPYSYDAWELSDYHKQKKYIIDNVKSIEAIPFGVRITREYNKSLIIQEITLRPNSKRIDFKTYVNWQETHSVLKAAFPLDVHSRYATYEIQFGSMKRTTHENTSWDKAQFEVCGHKWADISECDFGVALLNDCKYGYSAKENILSLTLLKSATYPHETADKGEHEFIYSLLPHEEMLEKSSVYKEATLLNNPLYVSKIEKNSGNLPENYSFAVSDKENIVIDTIKKAEESDDIIIRLYNSQNCKTAGKITLGFDFKKAFICDLMEKNDVLIPHQDNQISLNLGNFEIITLKISR